MRTAAANIQDTRKSGKKRLLLGLLFLSFLLLVVTFALLSGRADTPTIEITYTDPNGGNTTVTERTDYDPRLYSALLNDFGAGVTAQWKEFIYNGYTYTFAGWKLTEINGTAYTGTTYFYPDNDFVYMNDAPFDAYKNADGTTAVTSLKFEMMWGKTIYLRDPYNFKDIANVYGTDERLAVGAIDWDTSTVYSSDANDGKTPATPVATLAQAEALVGSEGGKIVIVNHYTVEPTSFSRYNSKGNLVTHWYSNEAAANADPNGGYLPNANKDEQLFIGKNCTSGVLTISGMDQGMPGAAEKANDTNGLASNNYQHAYLYLHNGRGNGYLYSGYDAATDTPTGAATYPGLRYLLYFFESTVLDDLNILGFRDRYNLSGARYTNDVFLYTNCTEHFVMESGVSWWKRESDSWRKGQDMTNWSHTASKDVANRTKISFGAQGFLQFYASAPLGGNTDKVGYNTYLTLRGHGQNDGFWTLYIAGSDAGYKNIQANNIHAYLDGIGSNSKYMAIFSHPSNANTQKRDASFIGLHLTDASGIMCTAYGSAAINSEIGQMTTVIEGSNSSRIISDFYTGGWTGTASGQITQCNIQNFDCYINGGRITNFYGGGSSPACQSSGGVYNYQITGGQVDNFFGGGLGGYLGSQAEPAKININIGDGASLGYVYGGGSGGAVLLTSSDNPYTEVGKGMVFDASGRYAYYPLSLTGYAAHRTNYGPYLRYDTFGNSNHPDSWGDASYYITDYQVGDTVYQALVINFFYDSKPGYYLSNRAYAVSDAIVHADIDIQMTGGSVTGDLSGGGKNGAVTGNINIEVTGGTVKGSVFGGGEGRNKSFTFYAPSHNTSGLEFPYQSKILQQATFTLDEDGSLNAMDTAAFNAYYKNKSDSEYNQLIAAMSAYAGNPDAKKAEAAAHINEAKIFATRFELRDQYGSNPIPIKSATISLLGTINGNTHVSISGGTVNGSVYGGSDGSVARINGSTVVNILSGTVKTNVFGGGNAGVVTGSTTVNLGGGTVQSTVYGGGNQAAIGSTSTVTLAGSTVGSLYGGGNMGNVPGNVSVTVTDGKITNDLYGGANQADIGGNVLLLISGGSVSNSGVAGSAAYGANNTRGNISGSVTVAVSGGAVGTLYGGGNKAAYSKIPLVAIGGNAILGDVYGGGNQATVAGTSLTVGGGAQLSVLYPALAGLPASAQITGHAYGGGNQADVNGNVDFRIYNCKSINEAYGGNNHSGSISGQIDLQLLGGSITTAFGGGNEAAYAGTPAVLVQGSAAAPLTLGTVYGGGNAATVASTNLIIREEGAATVGAHTTLSYAYGGGMNAGTSSGDTRVTVYNGLVQNAVYGGCNIAGNIAGSAYADIRGGNITYVLGGGNMASDTDLTTHVSINGSASTPVVMDTAFGGGLSAEVGSTNVTVNGVSTLDRIFGGGNRAGTSAESNADTHVTVNGGTVNTAIYGGNNYEGTVDGSTYVEIRGGDLTTATVYGGGEQASDHSATHVDIYGSASNPLNLTAVYGGGNNATVGSANVTVHGGKVTTVYGGGNNAGADTDTHVTVLSGTLTDVFGGNNTSGQIQGSTYVTVSGGTVETVYGGGNIANDICITHVNVKGSAATPAVITTLYGGGNMAEVGGTNVTVDETLPAGGKAGDHTKITTAFGAGNGTAAITRGNVAFEVLGGYVHTAFGGGNEAGITGNVTSDINGGLFYRLYGANNTAGAISGQVTLNYGGVADSTATVEDKMFAGGLKARYDGVPALNIMGGYVGVLGSPQTAPDESVAGCAYGGGEEAYVGGTNVTVTGGKLRALVGGSLSADIGEKDDNKETGAVRIEITAGEITTLLSGNDIKGSINGMIRVYIGTLEDALTSEGNDKVKITNAFGGGNQADYTAGKGWMPSKNIRDEIVEDSDNAFEGIAVVIRSGDIYQMFGGGVLADVSNVAMIVYGGKMNFLYGGGFRGDADNTAVMLYGGDIQGRFLDYGQTTLPTSEQGGYVFGGGYEGYVRNTNILVDDNWTTTTTMPDNLVIRHSLFGGGMKADVGDSTVIIKSGTVIGSVYGGGFEGNAGYEKDGRTPVAAPLKASTHVEITGGTIGVPYSPAQQSDRTYIGHVYGGGYRGKTYATHIDLVEVGFPGSSTELLLGGNIFGGGHEGDVETDTSVHLFFGQLSGNIYGGGRDGNVLGQSVVGAMAGHIGYTVTESEWHAYLNKHGLWKLFNGSEYTKFTEGGNIYGGGLNGTVQDTRVTVTDKLDRVSELLGYDVTRQYPDLTQEHINLTVEGSVFGGGYGIDATVKGSTLVQVDLDYKFDAEEHIVTADEKTDLTSGETSTTIIEREPTVSGMWSIIKGNIYGGGDMGMVGEGTIDQSTNTASIRTPGHTQVIIHSGHIGGGPDGGSVFGGGSGVPPTGTPYRLQMGAVFGYTRVHIHGGYIQQNVYGGGTQSRLYAADPSIPAAIVTIDETECPYYENYSSKIAIGGSIFGGGDRGTSGTTNASIPTTMGDVEVNIVGNPNKSSEIYILHGGVYGDGNLCLVNGHRKITLTDFVILEKDDQGRDRLKTFYSLQRADVAILNRTRIVLLGALDLVDESDLTIYSVNRLGKLELQNGSTVKLDRIVKELGALESDVETDREFVNNGNTGKNNYGENAPVNPLGSGNAANGQKPTYSPTLTDSSIDEVNAYRDGSYVDMNGSPISADKQNTVCVANGLYLQLYTAGKGYGAVKGLFTLQLLYATPGEGGGYVYSDVATSTGDFICVTLRGYNYKPCPGLNKEQFDNKEWDGKKVTFFYLRQLGEGFVQVAESEEFVDGRLYYIREETTAYMDVTDDIGGYSAATNTYGYFFWFINGPTINYKNDITGYIGADETSFAAENVIPQHNETYSYVLYGISGSEDLTDVITATKGLYELVQYKNGLTGQQISLEVKLGDTTLGFLTYDSVNDSWGLEATKNSGTVTYYGYNGITSERINNKLIALPVDRLNDRISIILHKSEDVNAEFSGMSFIMEMDITDGDYNPIISGASNLVFRVTVNIIRFVPEQNMYAAPDKLYSGVGVSQDIYLTGSSSFTVEYQTRYIPGAFPRVTDPATGLYSKQMHWLLSTKGFSYYFNETDGFFLTVDADGQIINMSTSLKTANELRDPGSDAKYTVFKEGDSYLYYRDGSSEKCELIPKHTSKTSSLPAGTKITMIDMTDPSNPEYYYYICPAECTEIDLLSFYLLNTNVQIGRLEDSKHPAFMKEYYRGETVRFNERLIFIFNFDSVDWESNGHLTSDFSFDGQLFLHHKYSELDIMDYAITKNEGATVTRTRVYPHCVLYMINDRKNGIDETKWSATVVPPNEEKRDYVFRLESFALEVGFAETIDWVNTLFHEQEYSVMIELLDGNGTGAQPLQMPAGISFTCGNRTFYPGLGGSYAVIAMPEVGDRSITVNNLLYALTDSDTVYFRITLYSAPDGKFYNTDAGVLQKVISFGVKDNPTYSLKAETADPLIAPGQSFSYTVLAELIAEAGGEGFARYATVSLESKTADGSYASAGLSEVFASISNAPSYVPQSTPHQASLTVREAAAPGTYRLVFAFGDRVEYLYFVIQQ